jgi:hypothetical protein
MAPSLRAIQFTVALLLLGSSWTVLWTVRSYWNPLAFFGLWTGAALLFRLLAGAPAFPWRHHLALSALSVPLWWWFEFVNGFVRNWRYIGGERYNDLEYALFASLAFSTVIPALDAAWTLTRARGLEGAIGPVSGRWAAAEIALGLFAQALVFLVPRFAFPLVWVAPFLVFDGLVALRGGPNLVTSLLRASWSLPGRLALAGLLCGFLWESWNVRSWPKWEYTLPFFEFWHLFEMPILGYLGYIPFVWSVYQLLTLLQLFAQRPRAQSVPLLRAR